MPSCLKKGIEAEGIKASSEEIARRGESLTHKQRIRCTMRSLVWFRSDLRVSDNTALHAASLASDSGVIGVFLMSPSQWREHDWAACRVDLMMRCVHELSKQLAALNIPLLIAKADRFSDARR
jgi:deoxyribodipyrimidine photolyase